MAFNLGKTTLVLLIIFASYAAYGIYAEKSASHKASNICTSITPGDKSDGLSEKAIADGASAFQTKWHDSNGTKTLFITFIGLPPFSRHICRVEAENGRITSKKLIHID